MDISVLSELQKYEKAEITALENKKQQFQRGLEHKKKELMDRNEMEIYEITSDTHNVTKTAKKKAKQKAKSTISHFEKQITKLKKAQQKTDTAVKTLFEEFLNQNV